MSGRVGFEQSPKDDSEDDATTDTLAARSICICDWMVLDAACVIARGTCVPVSIAVVVAVRTPFNRVAHAPVATRWQRHRGPVCNAA